MKDRILIIDDESQIRKILRITLEANGYHVIEASTAEEGLILCGSQRPDMVLLDLGLPDKDGLEVLNEIRIWSEVPVIILSVRNADDDIVQALDAGANDYITKPFNVAVLHARIRAHFRKAKTETESEITFGKITVDFTAHTVKLNNEIVKLTSTEYQLLQLLLQNRGRVVTHSVILKDIWGPGYQDQTQYLRVFIAQLRKKIDDNDPANRIIITESGVGYRLRTENE